MRRLAATLLVLTLAATGCLTVSDRGPDAPAAEAPRPGAPEAQRIADPAPRVTVLGPWRLTATPGEVVGAPGDVARVRLEVVRVGDTPRGSLSPAPWTRWADAPPEEAPTARDIPQAGAVWDVEVLVGPAPHVAFALGWEDPTGPERWPSRRANVSDVFVAGGSTVPTESRRDFVEAEFGLALEKLGSTLVATFAEGPFRDYDCNARASAAGPFRLVERDGTRTLIGFVESGQSDDCRGDAEPHAPRVVARLDGVPPGDVRVVVYAHRTCFCPPSAWNAFEASATLS